MDSFVLKKLKKNLRIKEFNTNITGFSYKIKNENELKVKEIIVVNQKLVNNLINFYFNKKYKKILTYYFNILKDQDSDSDEALMIALDEIARLHSILMQKYAHYLLKEVYTKMLKKLQLLENEIRSKIVDIKLIKEQEYSHNKSEPKSKSR